MVYISVNDRVFLIIKPNVLCEDAQMSYNLQIKFIFTLN